MRIERARESAGGSPRCRPPLRGPGACPFRAYCEMLKPESLSSGTRSRPTAMQIIPAHAIALGPLPFREQGVDDADDQDRRRPGDGVGDGEVPRAIGPRKGNKVAGLENAREPDQQPQGWRKPADGAVVGISAQAKASVPRVLAMRKYAGWAGRLALQVPQGMQNRGCGTSNPIAARVTRRCPSGECSRFRPLYR
ncbi:MAG: hypothetical protein MZU91_14260 [Desulfosudis oleivorans]|nr:hypothetical protein [Desulfosudis oleivorans]